MFPWDFSLLDDEKRAISTHSDAAPVNQQLSMEIERLDSALSAEQFKDPKRLLRALDKKLKVKDDAATKVVMQVNIFSSEADISTRGREGAGVEGSSSDFRRAC